MGASAPFVLEGEEIMREGESRTFSIVWEDFSTISTGGGGVEGYVNGSSDSANLFQVGASTVVTGNTLTLPKFTVPTGLGGTNIAIEPAMAANTQVYRTGIIVRVLKPGSER